MKAADVMTQTVVSVAPDTSVTEAVRIMLQRDISGLPVVDELGQLVGIVTEGDFLRRAETGTERRRPRWLTFLLGQGRLAQEYVHTHGRKVAEVMTPDVVSVDEHTPLGEIVRLMERHHIKRVPVTRNGKLVGIVSRANLLRAMVALAGQIIASPGSDTEIRDRLLAEFTKQPWVPQVSTNVIVRNGIVHLWGVIFEEEQRQAMIVAAENIQGVKGVEDHLVWVEPTSGLVIGPLLDQSNQTAPE
jgi:CBS-domain-containing membrane protein